METRSKMEHIPIKIKGDTSYHNAERHAREAVANKGETLSLIAWWDNEHKTGEPLEACGGEVPKCVRDYAQSHKGQYEVMVNDGLYEFYFSPWGPDVSELDRDEVIDIHQNLSKDEFDNIQGG